MINILKLKNLEQFTQNIIIKKLNYFSTINKDYHVDEHTKLLEILNNSTEKELTNIGISKKRSAQIVSWRSQNGYFQNIEQMLKINGFGCKVLERIKSIDLTPNFKEFNTDAKKIEKKNKSQTIQFTTPSISDAVRSQLKSCLSLHIAVSSVAWTRFELDKTGSTVLTNWNHHNINEKNLHVKDLVNHCLTLMEEIPLSDCYVVENTKIVHTTQPGSPAQINVNVQKFQLIAMIAYALSSRKTDENCEVPSKFYYLRKYLFSRLFDTLVGSESVSTEQKIQDLMKFDCSNEDVMVQTDLSNVKQNNIFRLSFPTEFRLAYRNYDKIQREFVGQSMLIGLTFIRLCLLKCPMSIEKIKGQSK